MQSPPNQEVEKFDFENLDIRLYLALKTCVSVMGHVQEAVDASKVMRDFVASHGELPEWAVARNYGYELIEGAQLCTKNGRRTGNAHIVRIGEDLEHGDKLYECITDAGSRFTHSEAELLGSFTIGDWISDPACVLRDFDRNGEFHDDPK